MQFLIQNTSPPDFPNSDESGIIGGSTARNGQFPYQAVLRIKSPDNIMCGGSILNDRFILTAAHCFNGFEHYNVTDFRVGVGNIDRVQAEAHLLEKIIKHKDYNGVENDLCLLKLKDPLEFRENIQPIDIRKFPVSDDENAIVSGWGYNGSNDYPTILQYLSMRTIDQAECEDKMPNEIKNQLTKNHLCTLPPKNHGPCPMDSGGPLAVEGELVGVVSWAISGEYQCANGYPDVYVRLTQYLEWIENNMKNN